jgi:hypothetical protein
VAVALPLETQTLYAELLEHLIGVQAQRSIGGLSGSFDPGGRKRQFYIGSTGLSGNEGVSARAEGAGHLPLQAHVLSPLSNR